MGGRGWSSIVGGWGAVSVKKGFGDRVSRIRRSGREVERKKK